MATAVKARADAFPIVAVIASLPELHRALRLRHLPRYFELRLDALLNDVVEVERNVAELRAPLVITARHPLECGMNNLPAAQRRNLLLRFLPHAACVDVELRSADELQVVLKLAQSRNVRRIISVHAYDGPADFSYLDSCIQAARALQAEVFKAVVRTETTAELEKLLSFFEREKTSDMTISAMGIGIKGRTSRILLARRGSGLIYAHLGAAHLSGQLSLRELRVALAKRGTN